MNPVGNAHHTTRSDLRLSDVASGREALVDWIDGIVWEGNAQTSSFSFVSPQAERILGYPAAQWLDEAGFWLDHVHPEDRELAVGCRISACRDQRNFRCDYRMRAADGRYVWLQDIVSLVGHDARGLTFRGIMLDITERKALEEALRRSETFLSAIYTSSEVGVFVVEVLGEGKYKYLGLSPVHERLMGLSDGCVVGKSPDELVSLIGQEAVDYIHTLYAQCIRERVPIESEFYAPRGPAQGWWFSRLSPVLDEASGRVVRLIGTSLPISSRKEAEAAVRGSEERLQLAVHASNVGLWDWDLRTQRVRYSREWKAQLGYEDHEIQDDFKEWETRVHPDDLPPTQARIQYTLAHPQGAHEVEFRMRHKDGSWRWIYTRAEVLCDMDGKPVRFLGGHIDITARKQAEEQIQRLANFPELNPNPVFEFGADGALSYRNAAADAMAAALGLSHASHMLPPNLREIVRECLEREQPRLRRQSQHGTSTLSWSFYPNKRSGVVHGYAIDISERLRLEEQLRQSQKMDAIGQLAGGIAHDFNNLLTVIQGNNALLHASHDDPTLREEAISQIAQAAERATSLTRQLLAFSRRQRLQSRPVDLNEAVRHLTTMLERIVGEDVTVKLDLYDKPLVTQADPGMLDQVLMNLTVNARDAMPNGGGLTFHTSAIHIRDVFQRHPDLGPGPYVRLTVTDTGSGIAAEHLPHIFEPFFTTKDVGAGTGLGLSTVFGIVKQHNGSIFVESTPGRGSCFEILLPTYVDPFRVEPAPERRVISLRGGTETILVVEDEEPLRQLLQRLLHSAGYRVFCAESGVAALSLCEERGREIDLVLTDVIMPGGVSGYDLAARLSEQRPGQRILFMSGYTGDSMAHDDRRRAGHNFLQKPFTATSLLSCVRSELDRAVSRV